ncbi:MAG: SDR family oxidoreductase [Bdellovibrionales bacterium]|nr:SDR family oxidoreductase [Bdellovibrionales bacterium]
MNIIITGSKSDLSLSMGAHLKQRGHQIQYTSHSQTDDPDVLPFNLETPQTAELNLDKFLGGNEVHGLILNAATATYRLSSIETIDWNELDTFIRANIQGNIWLIRKVLPHFAQQKFGRIIFMSSMNVQAPVKGYSGYALSKSAIETLMKYIAHEFGEMNITANSLRLGVFHTSRNDKYVRRSTIRDKMLSAINLKRLGKPEDLNLAIESMLDKNCYMNGATVEISGGISIPS